jgi:hypothetical protein
MFIAFCTLQAICIAFVWAVLIWRWICYHDMPNISSYGQLDFAMKTQQSAGFASSNSSAADTANAEHPVGLNPSADDSAIRMAYKNKRTLLLRVTDPGLGSDFKPVDHLRAKEAGSLPGSRQSQTEVASAEDAVLLGPESDIELLNRSEVDTAGSLAERRQSETEVVSAEDAASIGTERPDTVQA